jgi:hypothetical protein
LIEMTNIPTGLPSKEVARGARLHARGELAGGPVPRTVRGRPPEQTSTPSQREDHLHWEIEVILNGLAASR